MYTITWTEDISTGQQQNTNALSVIELQSLLNSVASPEQLVDRKWGNMRSVAVTNNLGKVGCTTFTTRPYWGKRF